MVILPFSGDLNRQVFFFRSVVTKDPTGEAIRTEQLVKSVRVKREDSASKDEEDGKLVSLSQVFYILRYKSLPVSELPEMFLKDEGQIYDIEGVEMIGLKRYVKIRCNARVI